MKTDRILEQTASVVSWIMSPLLIPTYVTILAMFDTYLQVTPIKARMIVLGAVFAFSCLVPLIVICFLKLIGVAKSTDLTERKERPIPYSVALVCYVGLWIYLRHIHAPDWLSTFFLASAISAVINVLVTIKWKISGHATGLGGLMAFTFFMSWRGVTFHDAVWPFILATLLAGITASARLMLKRHTVMQIVAGLSTGILTVTLCELL